MPEQESRDLREIAQRAEDAIGVAKEAHQRITDLESTLEERNNRISYLEGEIERLEAEIDRVDDRTDLVQSVKRNSAEPKEKRAAILVQTLYNQAARKRDSSANVQPRSSLTVDEAVKMLGGSVDRTTMYGETGDFQKAEDLVDDRDVLWYQKEPRGSDKNSRLILDLEAGDPPTSVAGFTIHGETAD